MDYLDLIKNNQVADLYANVFNCKLSPDDGNCYTDVLDSEEEQAVIRQFFATDKVEWFDFIKKYASRYLLNTSSLVLLAENMDKPDCRSLLLSQIKRFGTNDAVELAVCAQTLTQEKPDKEVLSVLCDTARHCWPEVFNKLAMFDENLAERYQKSAQSYLAR